MKIAITTSSFAKFSEEPLNLLRKRGVDFVFNETGRALTEDEAIALLDGCVGVAAGTEPLTRRVMDALPQLKVISRCGTGMDSVDIDAAREKGIALCNTPDGPTQAVAEITLGMMLDLLRHVSRMDREVRAGVWKKRMGSLLMGKKVGIVGFGRIGRAVARLCLAFGAEVAFADPVAEDTTTLRKSLPELLAWADIITLHCPKPQDGSVLLDGTHLRMMPKGARLVNAARGGLVDEGVLAELLQSGHLAGAAIDTFVKEPYVGALTHVDTALLTPHVGSYAVEARIGQEVDTIKNLLGALDN
ncbi:MAG: phosphoglycerate dehydrogenase [Desulfovibrionaceae bacterium]